MSGLRAVLVREVVERRLLLAGAALVGIFPLLVPFLPGVQGHSTADLRAGTAVALCLIVGALLAIVLGGSVLAGEQSAGRLGFYFARPLAGWAVWAGKLAGAAVLSVSAALLVLLPTLLVDRRIELGLPFGMSGAWIGHAPVFLGGLTGGCLLLLLLSHVVSSMARSRSSWLFLDLAAALTVAALVWSIWQTLLREWAFDAFAWGMEGFSAAVAVTAALASAIQVTRGRTDVRRSHRLLSLTFWSGLGIAAAGLAVYSHWVVDVSPADLKSFEAVLTPPAGSWIGLHGVAVRRGNYFPAFLFNAATGRALKIGTSRNDYYWWLHPVFAADASRAAWLEPSGDGYELTTLDLNRPGSRPVTAPVSFNEWPDWIALSPHGRLLAVIRGHALTVDDLEARKLVASIPLSISGGYWGFQIRFVDDHHLRLYAATSERPDLLVREGGGAVWRLQVLDLDPGHGQLTPVGGIELRGRWPRWTIGPDGWHAALHSGDGPLLLADLRTGTVLSTLPLKEEGAAATFLADGRLLIDQRTPGGATTLRLLDRNGTELRRFEFSLHVAVSGEVQPGVLAMAITARGSFSSPAGWDAFLLDLDSGRKTPLGSDLLPVNRDVSPFDRGAANPGSLGPRLFLQKGGALVLLDPATGRLRTLLRAHGR